MKKPLKKNAKEEAANSVVVDHASVAAALLWIERQRGFTCRSCNGFPQYLAPCPSCNGSGRQLYTRADCQTGNYWLDYGYPEKHSIRVRWAKFKARIVAAWNAFHGVEP